jgi:hypothetical protein
MQRLTVVLALVVVWTGHPMGVGADPWPQLHHGKTLAPCAEALQVATVAFHSDAFYLYAPPVMPADLGSVLVVKPHALDISGGDALEADPATFDKVPRSGGGAPRSVYWQKTVQYGYRFVLQEAPYGWRGDMYTLFAIGADVRPEAFLTEVNANQRRATFMPVMAGRCSCSSSSCFCR